MKRSILTVVIFVAAAGLASAASPAAILRLAAPVSPIAGLPIALPGPVSGPLSGLGISLPTRLTTGDVTLFDPRVLPQPFHMPARRSPEHLVNLPNGHDNVRNPIDRIMPVITIRFADTVPTPAERKEKLDELFDNQRQDRGTRIGGNRREEVGSSRNVHFPERELERELGL